MCRPTATEEEEEEDLLQLEYHPSFINSLAKRRRRWETRWDAVTQAVQALDRETDATVMVLAAPSHSAKLHSITSRSIRRDPTLVSSSAMSDLRKNFSALAAQRRVTRTRRLTLVDRLSTTRSGSSTDGSQVNGESREEELRHALEAALGSLNVLGNIYEQREARWRDEMKRLSDDRERYERYGASYDRMKVLFEQRYVDTFPMYFYELRVIQATYVAAIIGQIWAQDSTAIQDIVPRLVDPNAFAKSVATCKALNRLENEEKDIDIQYVDVNSQAERALIMVHGWPSLWHSWKYQIEEFKSDYRLIVPDLRGFGESTHPGDVQSSGTIADMVGDLVCTLEHAGISKAACIGHDWGAQICYEAARMRPDIFEAIVGLCIPYLPYAGPYVPTEALVPTLPKLAYNVFFDNYTQEAIEELNADVRKTLRGTLRTVASPPPDAFLQQTNSFLAGWEGIDPPPIPFLASDEEDYWVQQYDVQKFNFTLNFYTHGNRYGSWQYVQAQGNFTIPQPALSILSTQDPVADWALAAKLLKSDEFVLNVTTKTVAAAHWLQLERPDEVNAIMRAWLSESYPPISAAHGRPDQEPMHARDEL
ncbi:hypothetical protein NM688_g8699 [Phlebia brevispora]|uniref:Uncharacterized protein n=1 Tax=Phlebia brevispora TaxID=194682 RepID=A0ACC1RQV5_9APHY|nr:hypothetical protein NM688_g8699 [Phlebia brevispora]